MSDISEPERLSKISVDPQEMENFSRMASDWWNPTGKFRPLHMMNGFRIQLIKDTLCMHFDRDMVSRTPLDGLRILDIGCGGGLLAEPLTRLGGELTGIDALEKNVKTAMAHAQMGGLDIDYRHGTIEQMAVSQETGFDVVLNMEVIEHVVNRETFIDNSAKMILPGGVMISSTINRTMKAFLKAIVGAEYILNWLPRGTHQYDKMVTPLELKRWLLDAGLEVDPPMGMSYHPFSESWSLSDDVGINYMMVARKP